MIATDAGPETGPPSAYSEDPVLPSRAGLATPWRSGRERIRHGGPSTPDGARGPQDGTGLWAMSAIAFLAIWFLFHALVLTTVQEKSTQSRLYAQLRQELAEDTAPLGGVVAPGTPVALLSSGRGIHNEVVVEGTTSAQLTSGPGHLSGTQLPGQSGVSVLFGRSVTYGAPFGQIAGMKVGDPIKVVTGEGSFVYRVTAVRRPGAPLPAPLGAGQSRLTLVTSSAAWPGGWNAHVIYVDAILVKGTVQPPSAPSVSLGSSSLPMGCDASHLANLVFWLQALLLVSVALAWAWSRWTRWQAWVAGLPLVVAALWGATGAVDLLLPNLV